MTHDELVRRAFAWLKSRRCHAVLADVRTATTNEQPDAIGWRGNGLCELVECKASRSDFHRDAKKWHRRAAVEGYRRGMGELRWYLTAPGLVFGEDLPAGWGLAEVRNTTVSLVRQAQPFKDHDVNGETRLLVTALRRATEGWGRQMLNPDGDPHPSTAKVIRELRAENTRLRDFERRHKRYARKSDSDVGYTG